MSPASVQRLRQQKHRQTKTKVRMARKICNHSVFPTLRAKLKAHGVYVCPSCLIRAYILEIGETQEALERRGGVFASRDRAIAAEEKGRQQQRVVHRTLLRRWHLAKIEVCRDLCLLKELSDQGAKKTRWELQLAKAFELWEEWEMACSRVPGCKQLEQDEEDEDDVYYWRDGTRHRLLHEAQGDGAADSQSSLETDVSSNDPLNVHHITALVDPPSTPTQAPEKHKRQKKCSNFLRTGKKVRIDERVTVFWDDVVGHIPGPAPQPTFFQRPHFSYTTAEAARKRAMFWRRSCSYTPYTWALLDGYRNVDTSHYRMVWKDYDKMQLFSEVDELRDAQAEIQRRLEGNHGSLSD